MWSNGKWVSPCAQPVPQLQRKEHPAGSGKWWVWVTDPATKRCRWFRCPPPSNPAPPVDPPKFDFPDDEEEEEELPELDPPPESDLDISTEKTPMEKIETILAILGAVGGLVGGYINTRGEDEEEKEEAIQEEQELAHAQKQGQAGA